MEEIPANEEVIVVAVVVVVVVVVVKKKKIIGWEAKVRIISKQLQKRPQGICSSNTRSIQGQIYQTLRADDERNVIPTTFQSIFHFMFHFFFPSFKSFFFF